MRTRDIRLAQAALVALAGCTIDKVHFGLDEGLLRVVPSDEAPTVEEGTSTTLTVQLSTAPIEPVLITLSSADVGMLGVAPLALVFDTDNWDVAQELTLSGQIDDDAADEEVALTFTSATIPEDTTVAVTIDDADGLAIETTPDELDVGEGETASLLVKLTGQPTGEVVVEVASSSPAAVTVAPAVLQFTPDDWDFNQTVTLTGIQDDNTTVERVDITASGEGLATATVAVSVPDDDVLGIVPSTPNVGLTEGSTGSFTITLSQQPSTDVNVAITSGSTAVATVSTGEMVFTAANWDMPQIITVSAPADSDVADAATTISLVASGLTTRAVSVNVNDDDTQSIVAAGSVGVTEGSSSTVSAHLAFKPAGDVAVSATSLATGVATVSPASRTFTPANYATDQTFTVTGSQDADAEAEATTLQLAAVALGLSKNVAVNVTDDEVQAIAPSTTTVQLGESGTASFTVGLAAVPTATVTVAVSSNNGKATVSPSSLTFAAGDQAAKTVTVSGAPDADLNFELATISLTSSGLTTRTVEATVTEPNIIELVGSPGTVCNGELQPYNVRLQGLPRGSRGFQTMSSSQGTINTEPSTVTFTDSNYDQFQTFNARAHGSGSVQIWVQLDASVVSRAFSLTIANCAQ